MAATARWCGSLVLAVSILAGPAIARGTDSGRYAGRDAGWWIEQLADDEAYRAAQTALRKIGQPAVEPLSKALVSDNNEVRGRALSVLRGMRIDPVPVLVDLVAAIDTEDLRFTGRLLDLIQSGGRATLPHLEDIAPLVGCGHHKTVHRALEILVNLAPESRSELPRVFALARGDDPRLRHIAVFAAVRMAPNDPDVVAVLADALTVSSEDGRRDLLNAASHLRPSLPGLADVVIRCATDPSPKVRGRAAALLAAIVLEDRSRLAALVAMLGDDESAVRSSAAHALSKLATLAAPGVPGLIELLTNDDDGDDHGAVRAITAIGPAAAAAAPAMMARLERLDPADRMPAGIFVRYLAGDPELALRALDSENEPVRRLALETIRAWPPAEWQARIPAVLEPIERAILKASAPVNCEIQVLVAIRNHVTREPRATTLYLNLARAPSPKIRELAAQQLALRPDSIPRLLELLASEDAGEREFAYAAFMVEGSALRTRAARRGLLRLLRGERASPRDLAGRTLFRYIHVPGSTGPSDEDSQNFARVCARLLHDVEWQQIAITSLGSLGPYALPYLENLFDLLDDTGPRFLGGSAAGALRRIAASGDDAARLVMPRLEAALKDGEPGPSAAAATALAWGGDHDREILARLPALIGDPRPFVHHLAIRAAGNMGERGRSLAPALLKIARHPPEGSHVRSAAIAALANVIPGDERLLKICVERLRERPHGGSHVPPLWKGGEKAARLLASALDEADAALKVRILSILGQLGPDARCVVDRVRSLTRHPDGKVAKVATGVLKRIEAADRGE